MKILFDNYVVDADFDSLDASTNYPPENLADFFLRKRYQNVSGNDTLTVTFDGDKAVNSFYAGYHNAQDSYLLTEDGEALITEDEEIITISAADLTLNLYTYAGALLYTETITLTDQFDAMHFASVAGVRYATIVVDWSGLGAGYLGGIGLGLSYEMPENSVLADWDDTYLDESIVEESLGAQYTQDYVEPKDVKTFSFSRVPRADYVTIKAAFKSMGAGRPFWIDYTEDNHDLFIPAYVVLDGGIQSPKREPIRDKYTFALTFKEAR